MKCKNCKKENIEGTKYCKYCGELLYEMKTCQNGHQYIASEKNCPYCPPPGGERIITPFEDIKTTDKDATANLINDERTIIDTSKAILNKNISNSDDKTVIVSTEKSEPQLSNIQSSKSRKLIGWLVTFDIDPNGKDFRLYEGRNTIGKNSNNDVVLLEPSVSSLHSTILYRPLDKKLFIQDNLSTNGTFVNNTLIDDKQVLADNDIIRIGKINLKVKLI